MSKGIEQLCRENARLNENNAVYCRYYDIESGPTKKWQMTPEDIIALEMLDEQCSEETKIILDKLQYFLALNFLALI